MIISRYSKVWDINKGVIMERPDFLEEEHLEYLNDLRDSGETNMFGARPYLINEFGLSKKDAASILSYWMEAYSERNPA